MPKRDPQSNSRKAMPSAALPCVVRFGREVTADLSIAERREWLVTNGIGGFASGTVAGVLTRRYHGLLIAALKPPLGRTLLVSKLDETAEYQGRQYPLFTNRWSSGVIQPQGYQEIDRFHLHGTTPVWQFALGDALLEKRIWMQRGANTTCVRYQLLRGTQSLRFNVKALVNYRDFHSLTHALNWEMKVERTGPGLRITAFDGAVPIFLLSADAKAEVASDWYRDFDLPEERARGLESSEDHLFAGSFAATLEPGQSVTIVASTDAQAPLDGKAAYAEREGSERALLAASARTLPKKSLYSPPWIQQLVLAADQFVAGKSKTQSTDDLTLIAGYPWFSDWGRDTMIALPGLTLATGRPKVARGILMRFAKYVDQGMLPNRFPEGDEHPEYNSVDATLWYFEALRQYLEATGDQGTIGKLYPAFADIVEHFVRGTRFNIHLDPSDGLLYAGQEGVQLTWMDARVDGNVITPRMGKPVEINALWFNALLTMAHFARKLKKLAGDYESLARRARAGFARFWNPATEYCFDVLDGPGGNDGTIRPNAIIAVALAETPLTPPQCKSIVDLCGRELLTPFGLRSLAPGDLAYQRHYCGSPKERDHAYHQGTSWGWLMGPFMLAHLRVYNRPAEAASFFEPFADHLNSYGLGTAAEIFDGDAPFIPRGCIAQAWTVGEILRAWHILATRKA
jgi:predicted glycogen debranching enzyme